MTDVDVIICGAGPTGVALATMLAQRGKTVHLAERHRSVYPLPRAVHLDSEVYRILHDLGIGDDFAAISRPTRGLQLVDRRHRVLARFERGVGQGTELPEANLFDQPELEHILRSNLQRYETVTLHSGVELTDIQEDAEGVHATLVDVTDGSATPISGSFLVGCDGANSLVRTVIGSEQKPLGFEQRWLVVDVRTAGEVHAWDGVHQVCDPRRAATYMRIGDHRYRFEIQLRPGERADDFDGLPTLRSLIDPWVGALRDDEIEVLRSTEYTFKAVIAERWRRDRLLIAGDAAHLTPPFIGQGMCAGMRDAANLGWKLAAVIDGTAPTALLDTYQEERAPHARATIAMAVNIGRAMTGGGMIAAVLRKLVLAAVRRSSAVSTKVLDVTSPVVTGHLVDQRLHVSLRGALLPLVRIGAGGTFVDAALGHGWGAVVDGVDLPGLLGGLPVQSVRVSERSLSEGERELANWLRRAGVSWVLVRPDRVVLAAGRTTADFERALAAAGELLTPPQQSPGVRS